MVFAGLEDGDDGSDSGKGFVELSRHGRMILRQNNVCVNPRSSAITDLATVAGVPVALVIKALPATPIAE
jgi:hypothetical protein